MQKELIYPFFLLAAVLCGCSSPIKHKAEVAPLSVRVQVVGEQDGVVASTRYVGVIEAIHETPLSMQTAGRVKAVSVRDGMAVTQGQTLLQLDNTQAMNALRSAEATLKQAKDGHRRAKQVYAKGAITAQQMVEIESKLTQAQALYDLAQRQVDECELKAPCDGVVNGLDIQIGQTVVPGLPVLMLLDLSAYAVRFTVPEGEIGRLAIGQNGEVECTAVDTVLPCCITEKGLQANQLAHTYEVKAEVTGGQELLRPGMVGKVQIAKPNMNAHAPIIIPAKCVLLKPEGPTVWVKEQGRAVRRNVTVGGYQAEGVLVLSGLQIGDSLITDGYQKLYAGCEVVDN